MFIFFRDLLQAIFKIFFTKRKDLVLTLLLIKKENEILKQQMKVKKKRIMFNRIDRLLLSLIRTLSKKAISHLTLLKPKISSGAAGKYQVN